MSDRDDYKLDLEVFEGPLDLLLYLIKKDEIDIYDIPIERITRQYMEYLGVMRMLDLNIAGEFIVMASTLMLIKSRMLLPEEKRAEEEIEEEEDDPRWELVRQLVEYKKFKDAASRLEEMEARQEEIFGLGAKGLRVEVEDDAGVQLTDVSLFDLIAAFNEVLKRSAQDEFERIVDDRFTVADKIDTILQLVRSNQSVPFSELFRGEVRRHEIICTFLAILELIRLRQITALQRDRFGEIVISGVEEAAEVSHVGE